MLREIQEEILSSDPSDIDILSPPPTETVGGFHDMTFTQETEVSASRSFPEPNCTGFVPDVDLVHHENMRTGWKWREFGRSSALLCKML